MALRAVLQMAFDDEVIERVPDPPRISVVDKPRTAFTDHQYRDFIKAANRCVKRGDVVSGIQMTQQHIHAFRFIVHSFVRPTVGELFHLLHRDIQVKTKPPRLEMVIRKGKTGLRESFTMPFAVAIYKSILGSKERRDELADQFVFFPEYANRNYARTAMSRMFLHVAREAGLPFAMRERIHESKDDPYEEVLQSYVEIEVCNHKGEKLRIRRSIVGDADPKLISAWSTQEAEDSGQVRSGKGSETFLSMIRDRPPEKVGSITS